MNSELTIRIVLKDPPPNVDFGLQMGNGSKYSTIQKQRSKSQEQLSFIFNIKVKGNNQEDDEPDFLGTHVQGNAFNRFIYVDIGTYAGQADSIWSRRLKIPLTGITWGMIDQLSSVKDLLLETHVPGTGRDGGPNCATVKPFDGWQIKTSKKK